MEIFNYLRELNIASILLRIILSMLIGGVLGFERGRKNRPAGFRTYMLVSLGAALTMMTNQYVFQQFNTSDPVRMGAQVVSGIGFLGAGTIIVTRRNQIRGITTAAGLWVSACIGLAIGIGFYEGAIFGSIAIFITMAVMQKLDNFIHNHSRVIEIYVEFDRKANLSDFLAYARNIDFDILDIQIQKNKWLDKTAFCAILLAKSRIKRTHNEMTDILNAAPGIQHLEEM